jgi:heat shock protein HtpX
MADAGSSRPSGSGSSRRRRRGGRGRSGQAQRPQGSSSQSGQKSANSSNRPPQGSRSGGSNQSRNRNRNRGGNQRSSAQRAESRPPAPRPIRQPTPVPELAPLVEEAEVRSNRRRARTLSLAGALVPAVVVGVVVGAAASMIAGAIAGVVVLVAVALTVPRMATPFALRLLHARSAAAGELPRLENLVDGLCPTFGVRRPVLMIVDDEIPNACSLGSRSDRGVLVVTTALEYSLDLIELEGVIAHELSHLKRGDMVVSSVAVAVLAPLVWLSGSDRLLHAALGRGRELRADQVAVRAVRYPPGLCSALGKFETGVTPQPGSVFEGRRLSMSRWLWIDSGVGHRGDSVFDDLDLTTVRIEALTER